jgi:hypothetical protein
MKILIMKTLILLFSVIFTTMSFAQVPNYVPANGLVGWWPFNGNANDESGNGNNGTNNGATLTSDRNGNVNSAYSFDGNASFIEVLDNQTLDLNSFTISSWVNIPIPSVNSFNEILTKGGDSTENYEILIYGDGNVETVCKWTDDSRSGFLSLDGNQLVTSNNWTFITVTYSIITGKLKMYFNSNFVYEITTPNKIPSTNNTNLFIGKDPSNGRFCIGKIDDIGIWNRALTECEIQNLYTSTITPLTTESVTTSICAGSSYTWPANGQSYSSAQTGLTFVSGCNTATLNLTVTPLTTGNVDTSICSGASYTWPANGQTYTTAQSGVTVVSGGCTDTLNLTITPLTTTGSVTTSICTGTYTWPANGETYTTDTTVTLITGCNTATLNLTVADSPPTTTGSVDTSICAGGSYTWPANGQTYTSAQTGLTFDFGCNTATLNLTVESSSPPTTIGSVDTLICSGDSYTWPENGQTYTTAQSGITVLSTCNIATLNLTITPATTTGSVTTSICPGGSYVWPADGQTYITDTLITIVSGCNTATLNLTITPLTTTGSVTTSISPGCSYVWPADGQTYTTDTLITIDSGCNTATLNLTVESSSPPTTIGSVDTLICSGAYYTWPANGQTYTTAQSDITVVTECDSATLNLTITPLTTTGSITTSICPGGSYTWPANGLTYTSAQSGTTFVSGCNTATLNLIVAPSPPPTTIGSVTTSICPGGSYTWPANGQTYTTAQSGITVLSGCNTATLNLTITPATTIGSVTTSICPGDSYTWPANGQTYTTAQLNTVIVGCNTATLNLTITSIGSVTTSICPGGSYTWPANGVTYTTAQTNLTVVTGCNTATLNLTITPATTIGSVDTLICSGDSYTWPENGQTYTTAQTGLTYVTDCNTATLNLTVTPSTTTGSVTTSISPGCSYVWPANGQTYTTAQSGTTLVSGCNTATLNLTTENPFDTTIVNVDAIVSFFWVFTGITYTVSGTYQYLDPNNCVLQILNLSLTNNLSEASYNTFTIFPNPTNGDFTITGLELAGTVSSLTLTDMNGKVVKVLDTKATKFSMASIEPGVYFLNIRTGNKQEVLKIVKE